MQPRTLGAETCRFIELEATIPQCVDNAIKAVPTLALLVLAQDAGAVARDLHADHVMAAAEFDERMGGNTVPQLPRQRDRIDGDFRSGQRSDGKVIIELCRSGGRRPKLQWAL